jgi:hypothetical protein
VTPNGVKAQVKELTGMDNNEIQGLQIYLIDPSENGRNI